jgi:hypothetical protein
MKARAVTDEVTKKRREALETARGARFWMNLRTSLDESRARGIPLAEAKRLLQERLAAEGRTATKRPQRRRAAR